MKTCKICLEKKELKDFRKNRNSYMNACKRCEGNNIRTQVRSHPVIEKFLCTRFV
jgi:hypothetical protein